MCSTTQHRTVPHSTAQHSSLLLPPCMASAALPAACLAVALDMYHRCALPSLPCLLSASSLPPAVCAGAGTCGASHHPAATAPVGPTPALPGAPADVSRRCTFHLAPAWPAARLLRAAHTAAAAAAFASPPSTHPPSTASQHIPFILFRFSPHLTLCLLLLRHLSRLAGRPLLPCAPAGGPRGQPPPAGIRKCAGHGLSQCGGGA